MTSHTEDSRSEPMSPSMPDVFASEPVAIWKADPYLLLLMQDLQPLSARVAGADATGLHYHATLTVIDRRSNLPRMFITLERSVAGFFFCGFTEAGDHENYGVLPDANLETFATKALDLFRRRFDFSGEIEKAVLAPRAETAAGH